MKSPLPTQSAQEAREARTLRREEEILEAATALFAEHGYAETDTQLLAETLGVGKGTLYRYFPSKRELFLAVADRAMRRLREYVDAQTTGIAAPLEKIRVAICAYLTFFAQRPEFVELLIQERALFRDRTQPTFVEYKEASAQRWQAVYRELIAQGIVREMPVEQITTVISDLLYGTMFTNYFSAARQTPEVQTESILNVVFRGILAERAPFAPPSSQQSS